MSFKAVAPSKAPADATLTLAKNAKLISSIFRPDSGMTCYFKREVGSLYEDEYGQFTPGINGQVFEKPWSNIDGIYFIGRGQTLEHM